MEAPEIVPKAELEEAESPPQSTHYNALPDASGAYEPTAAEGFHYGGFNASTSSATTPQIAYVRAEGDAGPDESTELGRIDSVISSLFGHGGQGEASFSDGSPQRGTKSIYRRPANGKCPLCIPPKHISAVNWARHVKRQHAEVVEAIQNDAERSMKPKSTFMCRYCVPNKPISAANWARHFKRQHADVMQATDAHTTTVFARISAPEELHQLQQHARQNVSSYYAAEEARQGPLTHQNQAVQQHHVATPLNGAAYLPRFHESSGVALHAAASVSRSFVASGMPLVAPSTSILHTHKSIVHRPRSSPWPAIPVEEALKIIYDVAQPVGTRTVLVRNLKHGMILAQDVVAEYPHPAFRASIMDGYAVIASDGAGERNVIANSSAGSVPNISLLPGTCCRISTGCALPNGADAVVKVEDTKLVKHSEDEELVVDIQVAAQPGDNIREVGSDVAVGDLLLEKNATIHSAEIGILAGTGRRAVQVYEAVNVAVMSTGNELVEADTPYLPLGKIRDTNRPVLLSMLETAGFQATDVGIVPDIHEVMVRAIEDAFQFSDVLVVTGGVSMGEKDLLKSILIEQFHFELRFGRVFAKPGLPTTFATGEFAGRKRTVFGLPGNPVSSFVMAQLFVVPALRKMSGLQRYEHTVIKVKMTDRIPLDPRPEYRRAHFLADPASDVPFAQCTSGSQISSRLLSTRQANLLLRLPANSSVKTHIEKDELVEALVIGQI